MVWVTDLLGERGVPLECIPHETTYTSIEVARALGIAADEVVKAVVLVTSAGHALAVVPASLIGARMLVDPEVLQHEEVVFAAGRRTGSVKVRTADLFRDEPHAVAPLTRHPEEEI
jgi:prolyl-tRNA editing enzyme YbaK/EbsC (Cys-tRNA(Pro) deacylase)